MLLNMQLFLSKPLNLLQWKFSWNIMLSGCKVNSRGASTWVQLWPCVFNQTGIERMEEFQVEEAAVACISMFRSFKGWNWAIKIMQSFVFQVQSWWHFLFATFQTSPPRWCRSTWLCGPTLSFPSTRSWNHTCRFRYGISTVLWIRCCSVFPPTRFAGRAGELWVGSGLTATGSMVACLGCGREALVKKRALQPERGLIINAVEGRWTKREMQSLSNHIRGMDIAVKSYLNPSCSSKQSEPWLFYSVKECTNLSPWDTKTNVLFASYAVFHLKC